MIDMKNNRNDLYHRLARMESFTSELLRKNGYECRVIERRYRGRKRDMRLVYSVMKNEKDRQIYIPMCRGWKHFLFSQMRFLSRRFHSDAFEEVYQKLLYGKKSA